LASSAVALDLGADEFRADGLSLSRGPRCLFKDLSFQLRRGEALILRGANGSGKTSLLRVLAGFTTPDAGALENLQDALRIDGVASAALSPATILHALDRVGLLSQRHLLARNLSQGQKRRIGLARLMLVDKPFWLLDEPTNALDAEGVELFAGIVNRHLAGGGMACIASHLPMPLQGTSSELKLRASA